MAGDKYRRSTLVEPTLFEVYVAKAVGSPSPRRPGLAADQQIVAAAPSRTASLLDRTQEDRGRAASGRR